MSTPTIDELVLELRRLCRWENPAVVRIQPADVARVLDELDRVKADNKHLRAEKAVVWEKINGHR